MNASQRLDPGFELIGDRLISSLHGLNPGELALQRRGEIDRGPTNKDKAFNEASGGHSCTRAVKLAATFVIEQPRLRPEVVR